MLSHPNEFNKTDINARHMPIKLSRVRKVEWTHIWVSKHNCEVCEVKNNFYFALHQILHVKWGQHFALCCNTLLHTYCCSFTLWLLRNAISQYFLFNTSDSRRCVAKCGSTPATWCAFWTAVFLVMKKILSAGQRSSGVSLLLGRRLSTWLLLRTTTRNTSRQVGYVNITITCS